MWVILWHAIIWVPKLFFYGAQRLSVWSGTLYLYKKGKEHKIYYVLGAVLYISSWVLILLLIKETLSLNFSDFKHLGIILRKLFQ